MKKTISHLMVASFLLKILVSPLQAGNHDSLCNALRSELPNGHGAAFLEHLQEKLSLDVSEEICAHVSKLIEWTSNARNRREIIMLVGGPLLACTFIVLTLEISYILYPTADQAHVFLFPSQAFAGTDAPFVVPEQGIVAVADAG